jgi:cholest-4-en-3-one 26-monooxygenase
MNTLIDHPAQYQMLHDNPALVPSATEEILRWASSVMYIRNNVMHDTELRGQRIMADDKITIWYVSANRDKEVFDDPFRFATTRSPNEHVAFGGDGAQNCRGTNLTRMEINLQFEELTKRVESVERIGEVKRLRSNFINGIEHLPVRLRPSAQHTAA